MSILSGPLTLESSKLGISPVPIWAFDSRACALCSGKPNYIYFKGSLQADGYQWNVVYYGS